MTNRGKNKSKPKASRKKSAPSKVEAKGGAASSRIKATKSRSSKSTKKRTTVKKEPAAKLDETQDLTVTPPTDAKKTETKAQESNFATAVAETKTEVRPLESTPVSFDSTQIVEQLEFLIALHDEQQTSFGEDDKLLGLWKQRFDLQNEQLDQIAQSIEGHKSDESLDELLELFNERFDVLEQRMVQVESAPESKKPDSTATSESTNELKELLVQNNQRFEALEKQLEGLSSQLAKQNSIAVSSDESKKSDSIAFAESTNELKELLGQNNKRFEELEKQLGDLTGQVRKQNSTNSTSDKSNSVDSTAFTKSANELKELLGQNNKRFGDLEKQLGELNSQVAEQNLASVKANDSQADESLSQLFDLYSSHFSTQQSKLDELALGIECQANSDSTSNNLAETFNDRFESLGSGLEKLTSILQGQQQLLEEQSNRIDTLKLSATNESSNEETEQSEDSVEENKPSSEEDSASHWHRQKEAMLSKYGIDPKHRPSMKMSASEEPIIETMDSIIGTPEVGLSTANLNPEDAEAIELLKDQLNDKLRDAEVELSIKRAKLSQFNAELDEKRVELERRESALLSKQQKSGVDKKPSIGLLERLKRHLSAKERKNLDRM